MLSFVSLVLLQLSFQYGHAAGLECPVAGVNSLIYLDLEQLSLIALQQGFNGGAIQSPQLCGKGLDEECSQQQCCHEEVGCCSTNLKESTRKCGCKKVGDEHCSYSAPFAILANSECDTKKKQTISACLRENRGNEQTQISIGNTKKASTEAKKSSLPLKFNPALFALFTALNNVCFGDDCNN